MGDRHFPGNVPRNHCGTHLGSSSLLAPIVVIVRLDVQLTLARRYGNFFTALLGAPLVIYNINL